jgi:V8-like Glu-specific endopeptidase
MEGYIYIYGYPAIIPGQRLEESYLYGREEKIEDILYHKLDTSEGQSGSAIYVIEDENYYIIRVHVKGDTRRDPNDPTGRMEILNNKGVYLNNGRISRIKRWIKEYNKQYQIYHI